MFEPFYEKANLILFKRFQKSFLIDFFKRVPKIRTS